MTTVLSMLVVTYVRSYLIFQIDVKNAFIHYELSNDVYMTFFKMANSTRQVCHLCKALYDINQTP